MRRERLFVAALGFISLRMAFNWTCPHCNHAQSVIDKRAQIIEHPIDVGGTAEGDMTVCAFAIGCANEECNRLTLTFSIRPDSGRGSNRFQVLYEADQIYFRRALPASSAKPQPAYIPSALREDYLEACLIRDDSPKAAATLARRCLQGMIRDFCKITRGRLVDEISTLKQQVEEGKAPAGVTAETVDAIDHVRGIGNIGAHMEKDIDLIVSVDPGEAQALIELIEMLFEEWYVARHMRQQKLARIAQIGSDKKEVIANGRAANALPPPVDEA